MLHIDFTAEDVRVIANRVDNWKVLCHDNLTGVQFELECTDPQMGAVLYLMASAENDEAIDELMYKIVNPLFENCPQNCRPVP